MIPPSQISLLLADWTDPRNAVYGVLCFVDCTWLTVFYREMPGQVVDKVVHVDLAVDVIKVLFKHETSSKC